MKKLLIINIALNISLFCFAQNYNLPNPIDQTNNAYSHLISDYGPRYVSAGTKYHSGFDFDVDHTGDPAYCIESGNIDFPSSATMAENYAYLRVWNWRYMHINMSFTDNLGNVIWEIVEHQGYYLLVIREWDGTNLNTINVYGEANYPNNEYEGVVVRHSANAGEMVFRARDYGVAGDQGDHLHLDRGGVVACNWINPLQYLARTDASVPVINSVDFKYNNNNLAQNFNSNTIYGNVIIESFIDSRNEYDFNYLRYDIKRYDKYSKIFDWTISGENHLDINDLNTGASNIPQHIIRQVRCPQNDISLITNDTREGIFPVTNYGAGIAGEDIFKYHFNTQETDENSNNLFKYIYQDGKCDFRVLAQDFGYNAGQYKTETENETKIIDNYLPTVKKIEVMNRTGNVIYRSEWVLQGSNLVYHEDEDLESPINIYYDTQIKIWTSEDVKDFQLHSDANIDIQDNNPQVSSVWEYTIESNTIWPMSEVSFTISGLDLNDNSIVDLPNDDNTSIPTTNLLRNENGELPNIYGNGENFNLFVCNSILKNSSTECEPPIGNTPLPIADFTYSISGTNNNEATFTNNSEFGTYYYWDFGDGETSYEENPGIHTYPVEITSTAYKVTLSVTNLDGQTVSSSKNILIPGSNNDGTQVVTITGNHNTLTETQEYYEYEFYYNVSTNDSKYAYTQVLDFGDGSSSSADLIHKYTKTFSAKTYFPVLTVSVWNDNEFLGDYQSNFPSITIQPKPESDLTIDFTVTSENPVNAIMRGSKFNLTATAQNGLGKHTFIWAKYPNDMNLSEDLGTPDPMKEYVEGNSSTWKELVFYRTGQYLITLNVTDQYGHNGYKEFVANVVSDAGCADMKMYISECVSQWEVPTGQPINFTVDYSLNNCQGENFSAGKIEWSISGPNGSESLGCSYVPEGQGSPVNNSKCITFNTPGKHTVKAKIIPYDYYTDPNSGNQYVRLLNYETYYSTISKEVNVIDCSSEEYIDYSVNLPQEENNWDIESAHIYVNNKSTNNITLNDGANVTLTGHNKINIKGNFSAKAGSHFKAKIVPCPSEGCTTCTPDYSCPSCPYMYYYLPADAIHVSLKETSCSMGHGTYAYSFNVDDIYGGPYLAKMEVFCANDNNNDGFCNSDNAHPGSKSYYVEEDESISVDFYGTFATKAKIYANANIYGGNSRKNSSVLKIGCTLPSSSSTTISDSTLNLLENPELLLRKYDFEIYPNPTNNIINLEIFGDYTSTQRIEIYNIMGQVMFSKQSEILQSNIINAEQWTNGIYIIRLVTRDGNVLSKLLIKE